MGTNYYLFSNDKTIKMDFPIADWSIVDEPDFGYQLHMAKVSGGCVPLFEAQPGLYMSYLELKNVIRSGRFTVYDEYNDMLSWEEFDNMIQEWIKRKENSLSHIQYNDPFSHHGYYRDQDGYEFFCCKFR